MKNPSPTFAGWYPDAARGGTKYWDGQKWTGDTRPPRRRFAAASQFRVAGCLTLLASAVPATLGVLAFWIPELSLWSIFRGPPENFLEEVARNVERAQGVDTAHAVATAAVGLTIGACFAAVGVYLLRGRGPSTAAVIERIAENRRREQSEARQLAHDEQERIWEEERAWEGMALHEQAAFAHRRGATEFEVVLRVDDASFIRAGRAIEAEGWRLSNRVDHQPIRRTSSEPKYGGGHEVIRTVEQEATFYFVRNHPRSG